MRIRIVPVAAGLATAAGLAITGAFPASAEATATPSASATAYGQAPKGMAGEGGAQASPHGNGNTDPPCRCATRDPLTGDGAARVAAGSPRAPHRKRMVICLVLV